MLFDYLCASELEQILQISTTNDEFIHLLDTMKFHINRTKLSIINAKIILFDTRFTFEDFQKVKRIHLLFWIFQFILFFHHLNQFFSILTDSDRYDFDEVAHQLFAVTRQLSKLVDIVHAMLLTLFIKALKKLRHILFLKVQNVMRVRSRHENHVSCNELRNHKRERRRDILLEHNKLLNRDWWCFLRRISKSCIHRRDLSRNVLRTRLDREKNNRDIYIRNWLLTQRSHFWHFFWKNALTEQNKSESEETQ